MHYLKIIKSPAEHQAAMERLLVLMDTDPLPGTQQADELEVLAMLIEQYEQAQFPIEQPDPVDAIRFRMEQQGLKNKDLVPYIGSPSKVSEVLSGKRPLSLNMIRRLCKGLDLPADVLIKEPFQQTISEHDTKWQSFPLTEMKKRGYFGECSASPSELKEYAAEWMGRFLSSVDRGFDLEPALLRTTAHHRSNDKVSDPYSVWAWQVRVLQKASKQPLGKAYQQGLVDLEWMRNLVKLSWSDKGPDLAREYLQKSGIHLVIEPHLPKTYLDGAACLDSKGNPVVALTLRYNRVDNFWFTLMHELAHVSLHLFNQDGWFIDNLSAESTDNVEIEADVMAEKALLPDDVALHTIRDADGVRALGVQLGISPNIIAGRIRHDTGKHGAFGAAFREEVNLTAFSD